MPAAFKSIECLPGPEGIVLVGGRGSGRDETRVARKLTKGNWFEIKLPFEPPRSLPVAWRPDGSILIVGRNGKALSVDRAGKVTKKSIPATLLSGIVSSEKDLIAFGMGPELFIEQPDGTFNSESGDAIAMKLMSTVVIGSRVPNSA